MEHEYETEINIEAKKEKYKKYSIYILLIVILFVISYLLYINEKDTSEVFINGTLLSVTAYDKRASSFNLCKIRLVTGETIEARCSISVFKEKNLTVSKVRRGDMFWYSVNDNFELQ